MANKYLKRLEPENYRGEAWVHWVLTIQDRRTGWLDPRFLYKFRELQTHVAFRYHLACLIYCLMPDHIHLLWLGLTESSDQRPAMKAFRRQLNECLKRIGFQLQKQAYDRVLRQRDCDRNGIENLVEYIARNPERKGLVPRDHFNQYPYTGCLLPGFPEIRLFQPDSWPTIWRTIAFLRRTEMFQLQDPMRQVHKKST